MGIGNLFTIIAKEGYIEVKYGKCVIPIGCEFRQIIDSAFDTADRLFYDKGADSFIYKVRCGQ